MSQWLGHAKDKRYNSTRWRKLRKAVLAFNSTCALCGHVGAGSLDHKNPVELQTTDEEFFSRANVQPMHGTRSPCTICSAASGYAIKGCCNELRGSLPLAQARARLCRRTGLGYGETAPGRPRAGTAPSKASTADDSGERDW